MADILFYSTGEIFWVNDPPEGRHEHIGVPTVLPPVPPDDFFTYAEAAHTLERAGHIVTGAYGRQRKSVRDSYRTQGDAFEGDPQFLALGGLRRPEKTVLFLIATETGTQDEGGVDRYPRIPFTEGEIDAFERFRAAGGGVYVMWDHGQLGYKSLEALGLAGPIEPEPEPGKLERPNTAHSNDSTDSAKIRVDGRIGGKPDKVELSTGMPAGYLQKIIPATLLYRKIDDPSIPAPQPPHPIFNGVGGADGIWIPAHMHEGILNVSVVQLRLDETKLPTGVKTLAVHLPLNETSFNSFAVMAYQDPEYDSDGIRVTRGAIIWDTSFHHLVDINWASNGKVPWEGYVSFSSEGLWAQQFPPQLFEERLERGIKRLLVNAVRWLANELPYPPHLQQELAATSTTSAALALSSEEAPVDEEVRLLKTPQAARPGETDVVF